MFVIHSKSIDTFPYSLIASRTRTTFILHNVIKIYQQIIQMTFHFLEQNSVCRLTRKLNPKTNRTLTKQTLLGTSKTYNKMLKSIRNILTEGYRMELQRAGNCLSQVGSNQTCAPI